jgi:hypothetical protein
MHPRHQQNSQNFALSGRHSGNFGPRWDSLSDRDNTGPVFSAGGAGGVPTFDARRSRRPVICRRNRCRQLPASGLITSRE